MRTLQTIKKLKIMKTIEVNGTSNHITLNDEVVILRGSGHVVLNGLGDVVLEPKFHMKVICHGRITVNSPMNTCVYLYDESRCLLEGGDCVMNSPNTHCNAAFGRVLASAGNLIVANYNVMAYCSKDVNVQIEYSIKDE